MSTSEIKTNKLSFRADGFNIARGKFEFKYTVPIFGEESNRERTIRLKLTNSTLSYSDRSSSSLSKFVLIDGYYDTLANTLTPFTVADAMDQPSRIYIDNDEVARVQGICDRAV